MNRRSANWLFALVVFTAGLFLAQTSVLLAAPGAANPPERKGIVGTMTAVRVGVSKPLRDMKPITPTPGDPNHLQEIPLHPPRTSGPHSTHPLPPNALPKETQRHDPLVQTKKGAGLIPAPLLSFDGVGNVNGVQPADTTMDVSDTQILQWVNLSYKVYDKSGNPLGGPFPGYSFWAGLGGNCDAPYNGGDILVRWDQFASRWVVGQLSYQGSSFDQCVAVSTTSDALGSYYQYDFFYSTTDLNDYPKWGLWPDSTNNGFYITVRNFGASFSMKIMALDRASMLAGSPGTAQIFDVGQFNSALDGLEPADLRGLDLPPTGSLETYIAPGHPNTDGSPSPVIHLFQTFTDFSNPANSYITQLPDIAVADFDPGLPNGAPQVGGGNLETLQQFGINGIQYRADYRVFTNSDGSINHDSLLLLHDVNVNGACGAGEQGGERWHEVRGINFGGPPALFQEGTYGPCDSTYRWMGSLAQDASGDIALGFSATSGGSGIVQDPSVHYTGRLVGDPPGDMSQGEDTYLDSTQAFSGFRWGDYSTMVVDPVDQCTFWYTTMYGAGDWKTRIGSFMFPTCTTGPSGTLSGTVTDASNGNPIIGATVAAGARRTTTDSVGHYLMALQVGTYDVTASKYGYLPQTVTGVVITDGLDTPEDFALNVAPLTTVTGTVTDGSGQGWPLYAKIQISGPGFPGATLYTDPLAGTYSITLVQGTSYAFVASAVSPGYNTASTTVPLVVSRGPRGGGVVQNFQLTANLGLCSAPGYGALGSSVKEGFDAGILPPGWSTVNNSGGVGWHIATGPAPCSEFSGNLTGGTGPFALANSDCDGFVTDDTELITPSVDMSSFTNAAVGFNLDYFNLGDIADVDISTNGGSSWTNVFERTSSERGPALESVDITGLAAGQPSVMARFHYYNAFFAWWWSVDNVLLGACGPLSGGLVLGNVRDAGTLVGLNGATITNQTSGGSTTSFATPNDPNQDDGFYILFAPPGPQTLDASYPLYHDDIQTPTVVQGSVIRQDFGLGVGHLAASPSPLSIWQAPGTTGRLTLTMSNTGGADGNFNILELNVPLLTRPVIRRGPYADPDQVAEGLARIPKGLLNATSTRDFPPLPGQSANPAPLAAGDVINQYPTQIAYGWGVAFNVIANDFWISNLAIVGGDDKDYRYLTDGTKTGDTIDDSSWVGVFVGDGTFNVRTGMLWHVNVGGDNCIYELDPVAKVATGNKICGSPWTNTSQRGLAYDIATDTYFIGGWNEAVIYHIDGSGTVLDSAQVSLGNNCPVSSACIAGLAYNTVTGHLFVMTNDPGPTNVYVLDAKNNYAQLSSFAISGFSAFGGAGFEADCFGHLWLVDQQTQTIYEVDSGEPVFCALDIPWLSENPTSGLVPAGPPPGPPGTLPVDVIFNSAALTPGLRQAQLQFTTDTPFQVPGLGVNLTVLFADVPHPSFADSFIYALAGSGIAAGCGSGNYCPGGPVTRAQMAIFIEKGVHGSGFVPPAGFYYFVDVLPGSFGGDFINQLFVDKIVTGCSENPRNYCPNDNVTRGQMAVFIEKGVHGSDFVPPACTPPGIFADVPCPGTYTDFVEALYNDGIAAGCGGGNYCPGDPVTRAQMAVFIVKGFNIPHL